MSSDPSLVGTLERPLDTGEVLGTALRVYRRYPLLFIELTLAVVVPYVLIVLAATGTAPLGSSHRSGYTSLLVELAENLVVTPLISALHIHALGPISRGETPRFSDVFWRGVKVLAVVAAAQIVAAIGAGVGFIFLVVPGVFLATRWAVVAQAAAIEKTTWIGALRRSYDLTAGSFWHVLGVIFLVGVISAVIGGIGAAAVNSAASWVQVVVSIAVLTIVLSFTALSTAVLFYDLLARSRTPPRA
jgi:hypothetical protein